MKVHYFALSIIASSFVSSPTLAVVNGYPAEEDNNIDGIPVTTSTTYEQPEFSLMEGTFYGGEKLEKHTPRHQISCPLNQLT